LKISFHTRCRLVAIFRSLGEELQNDRRKRLGDFAAPGALSALGLLLADARKDYSRTLLINAQGSLTKLRSAFAELHRLGREEEQRLHEIGHRPHLVPCPMQPFGGPGSERRVGQGELQLADLQAYSKPFGTTITIEGNVGVIRIDQSTQTTAGLQ
jgi:N-methylhydantoinase A/oxoprolinase/acetone carboxylase beta subunit